MDRRSFVRLGGLSALSLVTTPPLPFSQEKSKLKITGVRLVQHAAQTAGARL